MSNTIDSTPVIRSLRHAAVRDLAWAVFSPPLISSHALADKAGSALHNSRLSRLTPQRHRWLAGLDREPASLHEHIAGFRSKRLGLYFEHLWHFFLQHEPTVELLAHNLPVRSGGHTVGEFDCLYRCRERRQTIHLELAVKYYLNVATQSRAGTVAPWTHWLGPGKRDRLDDKLQKLARHQAALAQDPAAQAVLEKLGAGGQDIGVEVELKGYLFTAASGEPALPAGLGAGQRLHPWLPVSQLAHWCDHQGVTTWVVLPRLSWLAPYCRAANGRHSGNAQQLRELLLEQFAAAAPPRLIVGLDDAGYETVRAFITPDNWPEDASSHG